MTEREPEADGDRLLAIGEQLARRVVDRGDVVGIERVPHAEHIGRHTHSDAEYAGVSQVVGGWRHQPQQRAPPEHMQHSDDPAHADDAEPLTPAARPRGFAHVGM
jgi:hypothetical protein